MVLGKNIAHDMKSGAEGAHFFGALLLTFSFDKHIDLIQYRVVYLLHIAHNVKNFTNILPLGTRVHKIS